MNWSLIGWIFIGCTAILLLLSKIFHLGKDYEVRKEAAVDNLRDDQVSVMERGEKRKLLLGDHLSPMIYPGLGLQALSVLPSFLDTESGVDGGLTLGSADGGLLVFARQIVQNRYTDGFSPILHQTGVRTILYGPTPFSYTSAVLSDLSTQIGGSLALFGHYGPEAVLWVDAVRKHGGAIFASGGTLAAQAVLFLNVRDLVIGESTFKLPHLLLGEKGHSANLFVEDVLRMALILALLIGILLKLGGVL